MCQAGQTRTTGAGPRWGRLYAILPAATAAFLLIEARVAAAPVRAALSYAIAGGVWGAMVWWVRTNRTALDRVEWCACASQAVRVRVVKSAATGHSPRVGDVTPVARPPIRIDGERVYGPTVTTGTRSDLAPARTGQAPQPWGPGGTR
jgi:hypothetical protein